MRFAWRVIVAISLYLPWLVFADQLIIEPNMGRAPLIQAIANAQHSVKLVMYGFTDQPLLDALVQQAQHGRTVQVILEKKPYKADDENQRLFQQLTQNHIAWRDEIPPYHLIHQKTLLIDNDKAIVMTFNFTHSTFKKERNFALVLDDPREVNDINAIFTADWNNKTPLVHDNHIVLSPDNSREKILNLIQSASKSIWIYAQNVSDYKIIGAIAKAARKGVEVKLLTSGKLKEKQETYLQNAGVKIDYRQDLIIHAKVFIIDGKQALLGSINLTRSSLDENRELSVLTQDQSIVNQLSDTFSKDWQNLPGAVKMPGVIRTPQLHEILWQLNRFLRYHHRSRHRRSYFWSH